MNIAIISSSYHPYYRGGGEYSVKALAEKLEAFGHDVAIITAFHTDQRDTVENIPVYRIKHPNFYWSYTSDQQPAYRRLAWHIREGYNISVKKPLQQLLKELKPEVVHIRNVEDFSPYACKVAHDLNIPVVVTLNSYTWLCPRATMFRNGKNCQPQCLDCKVITYPKKIASQYVSAVVGVSQFMIDRHVQYGYFPQARQQVIYTSMESKPAPLPVIKNKNKTFGYIGRIHPSKGVDTVIQSFIAANDDNIHQLQIAGTGPDDYMQYCHSLAQGRSDIVFLGKMDIDQFYPAVDVVIINSLWHEPFPRVLIEAYAYGRPVIAANTGGTPEMITEKTGYIVDTQQAGQLENAIRHFMDMSDQTIQQMQEDIRLFLQNNVKDEAAMYTMLYRSLQ
ncbi:MAG: glycosyltransferase family 4 protein [Cyclobacteriaceae bacterium]